MIIPSPFFEESIPGYLARMARLNGYGCFGDMALLGFPGAEGVSFIDARVRLTDICQWLKGALGDPEYLLQTHTCLPARKSLGEVSEREWTELVTGFATISIAELSDLNPPLLGLCPSCVRSDIREYGIAYWHRAHQIPILDFCASHGDQLIKFKLKRSSLYQNIPLPGDFAMEHIAPWPEQRQDPVFGCNLAKFCQELLSRKEFVPDGIPELLIDALRGRGLASKNGALRTNELTEYLSSKTFSEKRAELVEPDDLLIGRVLRSIVQPTKGVKFGRAFVLFCLFGDWAAIDLRREWLSVFAPSVTCAKEEAREAGNSLQRIHRARCIQYISGAPDVSRLGFMRSAYRSFRWLLHNDTAWLAHYLPIPAQKTRQSELLF